MQNDLHIPSACQLCPSPLVQSPDRPPTPPETGQELCIPVDTGTLQRFGQRSANHGFNCNFSHASLCGVFMYQPPVRPGAAAMFIAECGRVRLKGNGSTPSDSVR